MKKEGNPSNTHSISTSIRQFPLHSNHLLPTLDGALTNAARFLTEITALHLYNLVIILKALFFSQKI